MAIYKLLRETAFDAETAEAMGQAHEALLLDLGLEDRHDLLRSSPRKSSRSPAWASMTRPRYAPECWGFLVNALATGHNRALSPAQHLLT